jgi:hypothetical protein
MKWPFSPSQIFARFPIDRIEYFRSALEYLTEAEATIRVARVFESALLASYVALTSALPELSGYLSCT